MERFVVIFITAVLTVSCAACTAKPRDVEIKPGKVADQRLAAYIPIRRLTYRDVCGREGQLSICVDRISISDSATLVEARIRNTSPHPYVQENIKKASVFLADDTGMTLVWDNGENVEYPGLQEQVVHFRMEGHFSGEPTILMVNNIRMKSIKHVDRGFSIVAKLPE